MGRHLIFIVNDDTWQEHNKVGIAAINDPLTSHPENRNANAARQSAISEISGIRPGDTIFFNIMRSHQHPPQLIGTFKTTSKPYFAPRPLYPTAKSVNETLPFRVEFESGQNFPNPINIDEIWVLKDKQKIWTLQQSRGDAVGIHACVSITRTEADYIKRLLQANNLITDPPKNYAVERENVNSVGVHKQELPIDLRVDDHGRLHYEAVLEALILEDFADGKHKETFGEYTEFIPYVPTGSRKEIDVLLLKHINEITLWYQILELKASTFTMAQLQKLIDYEKWFIEIKSEFPTQVHPVGIAAAFNGEVIEFVQGREKYRERPIRLLKYTFNSTNKSLDLEEIA